MKVPSLVVAGDGTQLAMLEEGRVTVVDLATMRARSEIGLAGAAEDSDVALAGVPSRLVVVTRMASETRLFVVDPAGPEKLGEASTRANMRLGAIAGDTVLLIGPTTALVDLRNLERPPSTLPVRGAVMAAGSMGDTRMVLVMSGALEEWDAATRSPVKRMRLDRPLDLHLIGGSERRIWMVVKAAPQQIEIIHSQTRSTRMIEVPEPIVRLHAHPYVDVLLAVCESSTFVVRTDREQVTRVPGGPFHDCVWAGNQIVAWPVDGYPAIIPSPIELKDAASSDEGGDDLEREVRTHEADVPASVRAEAATQNLRETLAQPTFSERLAVWKSKLEESRGTPAAPPISETSADATAQILERRSPGGWRGEAATWARAVIGRSHRPLPFLDPPILDSLMSRFELGSHLRPAIVLLYGAHLIGGVVARYDLASVIEWRWDELATGALVTCGLVRAKRDRFALLRETIAALDESSPRRGTLIGNGMGEPGAAALVAPRSVDAQAIIAWGENLASAPLFVPNERGHARLDRFVLEARIRGAVPVVPDDATATAHGLSIAARWPGLGVA